MYLKYNVTQWTKPHTQYLCVASHGIEPLFLFVVKKLTSVVINFVGINFRRKGQLHCINQGEHLVSDSRVCTCIDFLPVTCTVSVHIQAVSPKIRLLWTTSRTDGVQNTCTCRRENQQLNVEEVFWQTSLFKPTLLTPWIILGAGSATSTESYSANKCLGRGIVPSWEWSSESLPAQCYFT